MKARKQLSLKFRAISSLTEKTFIRYILTGVLNTLVGYSFFVVFIFFSFHYSLAIFLATCLGVVFNYFTLGRLVFKNLNKKIFPKFVLGYVFLYILNVLLCKFQLLIYTNVLVSGFISLLLVSVIGYLFNKKIIFQ